MSKHLEEKYPEYTGLTLIPKHWHTEDEDSIYCECVERPELSRYFFYLWLDDCNIVK